MKKKCFRHKSFALLLLCSCVLCFAASEQTQEGNPISQKDGEMGTKDALGIVIGVLKGDDEAMQAVAIAMVREMPGTETTKALARELPNLSVTSQVQLLSALADRGDRAALPAVVRATKVENESVRIAALKALGQLGDASSVGLLAESAAATRGAEQKAARESLYRLRGPGINDTILANIPSAEPAIKVELIRSIGRRNVAAGVRTLLKTAQDSNSRVRIESFRVLKTIAGPKYLPALVDLLIHVRSEGDRREAEKTVAAVARRIVGTKLPDYQISDRNRRTETILAVLGSVKKVAARCSLLNVLGKIGDDSALPALRTALKDKDAQVLDAAIRALSDWPHPEPIADLLKVAQNSDNKIHRILALRGYVRLIGLESRRPAKETIGMYKQAMSLTSSAALKRLVLSGLANVKSIGALEMAGEYLEDKSLQQEAESAVVKIAGAIGGSHPQKSKDALKKVIQTSKNDFLRRRAQEVINQIEGLKLKVN